MGTGNTYSARELAAGVEEADAQRLGEERIDAARDGHVQAAPIGGVLEGRHGHTVRARRVAILGRLGARRGVGQAGIAGQVDGTRERRGVGRALHPLVAVPEPRDVGDDGDRADHREGQQREQHQGLAALAPPRHRWHAGRSRRRREQRTGPVHEWWIHGHPQLVGLSAMIVWSTMPMVDAWDPPTMDTTACSGRDEAIGVGDPDTHGVRGRPIQARAGRPRDRGLTEVETIDARALDQGPDRRRACSVQTFTRLPFWAPVAVAL